MDADSCEHLGRTLRLVGLYTHLVTCDPLVVLLPKDRDDIECCAAGQPNRD